MQLRESQKCKDIVVPFFSVDALAIAAISAGIAVASSFLTFRIDSYETVADRVRGRRHFYSARVACSKCHATQTGQPSVGPSLFNARMRLTPAAIRSAIEHPGFKTAGGYGQVTVVRRDGRIFTGRLTFESDTHLWLDDAGELIQISKREIAHRATSVSAMPTNSISHLSADELDDLVVFVSSL